MNHNIMLFINFLNIRTLTFKHNRSHKIRSYIILFTSKTRKLRIAYYEILKSIYYPGRYYSGISHRYRDLEALTCRREKYVDDVAGTPCWNEVPYHNIYVLKKTDISIAECRQK